MSFDWSLIWDNIPILLQGAVITIQITVMAVGCGFFIGMIAALANLSRFKIVRLLVKCYVELFRGTPLLVQIFMIYFACQWLSDNPSIHMWLRLRLVVLTPVLTFPKFSVPVFSLSIKARWKLVVP